MYDCFILWPFWKVLGPWGSLGQPGGLSLSFYFSEGGGNVFIPDITTSQTRKLATMRSRLL